jgi:hypothetical protein
MGHPQGFMMRVIIRFTVATPINRPVASYVDAERTHDWLQERPNPIYSIVIRREWFSGNGDIQLS